MGKDTNIEWCDSTINGTSGCDGCELWNAQHLTCYAGTLQTSRLSKSLPRLYSPDFSEVRMIPGRYAQAASWPDLRGMERPAKPWLNGMPRMIFVGDLGDTFSRAVTDDFLTRELFGAITSTQGQRHFWMLLTKRPKRLAELAKKWGGLPDNCMAMTTVTSQKTALRVADLLEVRCKWKGLSVEPLLEAVNLRAIDDCDGNRLDSLTGAWGVEGRGWTEESSNRINLVICGGESGGPKARPMHPDWARSLRDQCSAAGVAFFFKQWGDWACITQGNILAATTQEPKPWHAMRDEDRVMGNALMRRVGKKKADRVLDGRTHDEFPKVERGTGA